MNLTLLLPLALALLAALATMVAHRRLRPDLSAPLLTAAIIGVVLAVLPVLVVFSLGFVAHHPLLGGVLDWCHHVVGFHGAINPWVGGVASLLLAVGTVRASRVIWAWRRFHRSEPGAPEVVDADDLFAYSLPGPGRRVVVSSGLIERLEAEEFAIVMAHEHSHAEHRHDRHLLIADLAVAVFPLAAPLRRRLRFVLERWADESAAASLGADRRMVARTLARVAVAQNEIPRFAAGVNGLGVAARAEALLRPVAWPHQRRWLSLMSAGVGVVVVAAGVQAHHLTELLATLCSG
ncbi:M56 family metallopeptidase [Ilumatobacter sp.]|uniref:M56 family metallopeptidase n=1 Tax=Ilumatobacter sp. TaxID=1967498 RepID=UPI003AF7B851